MIISLLQAVVYGAVQGITEFLPISSTGHLLVLSELLKLDKEKYGLTLVLFTNIATAISVIWYFRKDLRELLSLLWSNVRKGNFSPKTTTESTPFWIVGVTVLVGIAGIFASKKIDSVETLPIVAASLIIFGAVMLLAEKFSAQIVKKSELSIQSAYAVGLAQILAFIPGVSRSGATISAGLFLKLDRSTAARYSFLLSIPVIALAVLKQLVSERNTLISVFSNSSDALFYVVAFVTTLVTSYWAISALLRYLQHASLAAFAYYRFALGAAIFLYLAVR